MPALVNVALAQYGVDADPAEVISRAKAEGAEIVVFPEMFSNGYSSFDPDDSTAEQVWRAGAVSPDGPFVARFRKAARDNHMHVVATFLEAGDSDPFNAAVLIDPDGETVLHHRKVHICDFDWPEKVLGRGDGFATAEIETSSGPVKVGLLICMDREYADGAGALSRSGAEIILVPNSCDLGKDPLVGDVRIAQMRGRAFETVTGMAVANYPRPKHDGHSFAVGALGEVIALAGEEPALVHAEFDLAAIRRTREEDWFRWRT